MIEIKLVLYDPYELAGIQAYYGALLDRREKIAAVMKLKQAEAAAEAVEIHEGRAEPARVDVTDPDPELTGLAQPEPDMQAVSEPTPVPLDPKDIFQQYYQTHGFANARKKLDAFGAQRFSDITIEQLPAFLASLTAAV